MNILLVHNHKAVWFLLNYIQLYVCNTYIDITTLNLYEVFKQFFEISIFL